MESRRNRSPIYVGHKQRKALHCVVIKMNGIHGPSSMIQCSRSIHENSKEMGFHSRKSFGCSLKSRAMMYPVQPFPCPEASE